MSRYDGKMSWLDVIVRFMVRCHGKMPMNYVFNKLSTNELCLQQALYQ